ncbi:MAG TPA: MFS transporter [Chloroflexota bacterium]|jgi:MFS family permease|nr:MFS transporter [Chloroflexota bacterium]
MAEEAPLRMTGSRLVPFLGCSLAVGVFNAFNNFTLPLWLSGFTTSYVLISLLGNSRSFESAIVSPLAGAWSDRTWLGRLGRRRPFILSGGLASGALLALTPLTGAGGLVPVVAMILLFTVAFNVADDVHKALMTDLVDGPRRNWVSSLMVVVDIGGQVGILLLGALLWSAGVPDGAFAVAGGVVAAGMLLTVVGVGEPPPAQWRGAGGGDGGVGLALGAFVREYRGAAIFLLVSFFYWSGVNAVLPLVSVYTRDILGATPGEAQLLPALLLLSTTVMAIPTGWLGARVGKRRLLALGYALMGLAALSGLVITTKAEGAALFFLAGVGNAATIVLAVPLLGDLVPRQRMGVAAGLLAASGSVAAPLASLVGGLLAELYGPRAIFAVMAATSATAVALLPATARPPTAPARPGG